MAQSSAESNYIPLDKVQGGHDCIFYERLSEAGGVFNNCLVPGQNFNIGAVETALYRPLIYCKVQDIINSANNNPNRWKALQTAVDNRPGQEKLYYFGVRKVDGLYQTGALTSATTSSGQISLRPPKINMQTSWFTLAKFRDYETAFKDNNHQEVVHLGRDAPVPRPAPVVPNLHDRGPSKLLPSLPPMSVPHFPVNKARTKLPNGPVPLPLLQVLPAMHRKMETVDKDWAGQGITKVEAEAFSQHQPMSIRLVNTYMGLLRIDEHRDQRSCYLDAVDVGQPLKAEFLQELSKSSDKQPDRIFLPCWTKEHVSLLVIKPKAEPKPMIEVWDPVRHDQRFDSLESHGVIQVIKQHIGATVEIELTHATKLPFVVEKQESGVIALMVARRLSRHTSESEKAAMKGLLSLEASQSWKREAEHIAQMRRMMFNEMFSLGHLVEPPHNLVESAPYGPFH